MFFFKNRRYEILLPFILFLISGISCRDVPNDMLPELLLLDALNPPAYSLGGPVTELYGSETILTNRISPAQISFKKSRSEDLPLEAGSGDYTFKSPIYTGESYEVSVTDHPRSPTQFCSLENASGKIDNKSRDNVSTFCEGAYRVTTNLTGLKGSGLVLTSTAGDTVEIEADGAIEMPTPFVLSASYEVTVNTNPTKPWQTCRFTGDAQTVTGANESENDLTIDALTCVTNEYPITANISGLVNSGLYLTLNGTDVEVPAGSTSYVLGNIVSGVDYTVTLAANAVGQECSVFGGKGSITDKGQSVEVSCTQNGYMVGGGLDNYNGSGLTVKLSGSHSETKEIDAGRTGYYFNSTFNHNDTYSIAITAQPTSPWQMCSITQNASGKILASTGSMADADISCTTNQYGLSGSISGLSFSGLVLDVNGTQFTVAAGATSVDFGDWDSGTEYTVSIDNHPANQECSVSNSTGTVENLDISNISVSCWFLPFDLSGSVTGLVGSDKVTISNNSSSLGSFGNGSNQLLDTMDYNSSYSFSVSLDAHASGYTGGTCSIAGGGSGSGSGTLTGDVTNLSFTCVPASKALTVAIVSGDSLLNGGTENLQVQLNSVALPVLDSSNTSTAKNLAYGSSYTVKITHQPIYTTCTLPNGSTSSYTATMPATTKQVDINCSQTKADLSVTVTGIAGTLSPGDELVIQDLGTTASGTEYISDAGSYALGVVDLNESYEFSIVSQPAGYVCAFEGSQFGKVLGSTALDVRCTAGYMVGGNYSLLPAAPLDYRLYQGKSSTLVSGKGNTLSRIAYADGKLYYIWSNRIYSIETDGTNDTIVAGQSDNTGGSVDGTGTSAFLDAPMDLVSDGVNLYFTEQSGQVRRITIATGEVKTIISGHAKLTKPMTLALDQSSQTLYISDNYDQKIYKYDLTTGDLSSFVTTAAANARRGMVLLGDYLFVGGTGSIIERFKLSDGSPVAPIGSTSTVGFQDGACSVALFHQPWGLATDGSDLYVTEYVGNRIRKISNDANANCMLVSTIAGSGGGTDTPETGAAASFNQPHGITSDGRHFYIATYGGSIMKLVDSGLVGYWPLNGSAKDYASDVATPWNGTLYNNPSLTTDRYGRSEGAYSFNGVDQYANASYTNLPVSTNPSTTCAWISPDQLPASDGDVLLIAGYGGGTSASKRDLGLKNEGGVQTILFRGYNSDISFPYTIPIGQWSHLCATFEAPGAGNHRGSVYVNGHLVGKKTMPSDWNTVIGYIVIGGESINTDLFFNGSIADVRIYNRSLNEGEINELAQDADPTRVGAGYNTGPTGLLSYYSFDFDGSAPSLVDGGPLGYGLTNHNSASSDTGKDGDDKGAYTYNGSDQYLNASSPTGLPLGSHPRTLCTWVKPSAYPGNNSWKVIQGYGNYNVVDQTSGLGFYRDGSGNNFIEFMGWGDNLSIAYNYSLHSWIHICGIYDSNKTATLYVNGKDIGSQTKAAWNTAGTIGLRIGGQTSGYAAESFPGTIDDVRIYNNALTPQQVQELAADGGTGALDTAFGGFGTIVESNTAGTGNDYGISVAINSTDEIAVGGQSYNGTKKDGVIWKYTNSGAADTSFNGSGIRVISTLSTTDVASSEGVQFDSADRIVATGSAGSGDSYLVRLNPAGAFDTTFSSDGFMIDPNDNGIDLAIAPSGSIYYTLFAWGTDYDLAVKKYVSGESVAWTKWIIDANNGSGTGITLDASENVYVVGYTDDGDQDFVVLKYTSAGGGPGGDPESRVFDGLAGSPGLGDVGQEIALDTSGQVVAVGYAINDSGDHDMVLMRLNVDLSYDTTLNASGLVVRDGIAAAGNDDLAYGLAIDSKDRIVVVGKAFNGSDYDAFVCRYLDDGSIDTGFGNSDGKIDGCRLFDGLAGGGDDVASDVAIDSLDRIVVTGTSDNGIDNDMFVMRILP